MAFSASQHDTGPGLYDLPTTTGDPVKGPSQLTSAPPKATQGPDSFDYSPSYSADGTKFVYLRFVDGSYELRESTNPNALISDDEQKVGAALSPNGSKIAFDSFNPNDHERRISVVNYDGSGLTELVAGSEPAWSSNGAKIAYGDFGHIHIMDADGSNDTTLPMASSSDMSPDWSPDGTKIVFAGIRPVGRFNLNVYTMNADGSGVTRLTSGGSHELDPVWSPDGAKVAYVWQPLNKPFYVNSQIYTMGTDGKHRKRLTLGKHRFSQIFSPSWSIAP